MKSTTPSQENYLRSIIMLSPGNNGVRISDMAVKLDVSKASVCVAANNLEQLDLIERDHSRLVYLTPKGKEFAYRLLDKHSIIKAFLIEILQIDAETAQKDACAMEHLVSDDTLCSMCNRTPLTVKKNTCLQWHVH